MKKWIFATLVALLALSLVLTSCDIGGGGGGIKVGMVSDVGGVDDASFNQNTWEGLAEAQEELGVEAQFIESQAQADYEKNITEFAEQDYDLIITVGFLLGDATGNMAAQYPDTNMAIIDFAYDPPIPNVAGIVFNVDEAAFPIGYLAAGWAAFRIPATRRWAGSAACRFRRWSSSSSPTRRVWPTTTSKRARTSRPRASMSVTLRPRTRARSRASRSSTRAWT